MPESLGLVEMSSQMNQDLERVRQSSKTIDANQRFIEKSIKYIKSFLNLKQTINFTFPKWIFRYGNVINILWRNFVL